MSQHEDTIITKALMLGYTFEIEGKDYYNVQLPDGDWWMVDGLPVAFEGLYVAARAAILHAGVLLPEDDT